MNRPGGWYALNEALAFALELVVLAVLSLWGVTVGHGAAESVLLGIAAPLAGAVLWGLFAAPRARIRLPLAGVLAVKAVVFAAAVAALAGLGHPGWAAALAVVLALSTTLAVAFRPQPSDAS
ncbi:MAG TPA: YrdB family protein [Streptosporangiaceae bacterium]